MEIRAAAFKNGNNKHSCDLLVTFKEKIPSNLLELSYFHIKKLKILNVKDPLSLFSVKEICADLGGEILF